MSTRRNDHTRSKPVTTSDGDSDGDGDGDGNNRRRRLQLMAWTLSHPLTGIGRFRLLPCC